MSNKKSNFVSQFNKLSKELRKSKKSFVKRKNGYYRKGKNGRRVWVRSHNQTYYKRSSQSDMVGQRERIQYYTNELLRADEAYREQLKALLELMKDRKNIQDPNNPEYISDNSIRFPRVERLNKLIIVAEQLQEQNLARVFNFGQVLNANDVNPQEVLRTHRRIPNLLQEGASPFLNFHDEFKPLTMQEVNEFA
jgi:hypothetical protein